MLNNRQFNSFSRMKFEVLLLADDLIVVENNSGIKFDIIRLNNLWSVYLDNGCKIFDDYSSISYELSTRLGNLINEYNGDEC